MILGIGCDLIEIARIERAIERNPHFFERVYTPEEREYIASKRVETAAGLFAAKEAVAKALGTGFRGFLTDSIRILPDELGRPCCTLSGGALKRARELGVTNIHVSVTHTQMTAAAFAVAEGGGA